MPDRFYAPVAFDQPLIELSPEESHHLRAVLRKDVGERVILFDGRGGRAEAEVETLGRRTVIVRTVRTISAPPPEPPFIALATAAPKGDRARWLIEKATELGAASWTPLHTARGVVDPRETKLQRLRQTAIAACKQCGRDDLLEMHPQIAWREWLRQSASRGPLLVAHPAGESPSRLGLNASTLMHAPVVSVAIGPEGGFDAEELRLAAEAGAQRVNLGPHILRIETAAIAVLAWLRLSVASRIEGSNAPSGAACRR